MSFEKYRLKNAPVFQDKGGDIVSTGGGWDELAAAFENAAIDIHKSKATEDIRTAKREAPNSIVVASDGTITQNPAPRSINTSEGRAAFEDAQSTVALNAYNNNINAVINEALINAKNNKNPIPIFMEEIGAYMETIEPGLGHLKGAVILQTQDLVKRGVNQLREIVQDRDYKASVDSAKRNIDETLGRIRQGLIEGEDVRFQNEALKLALDTNLQNNFITAKEHAEYTEDHSIALVVGRMINEVVNSTPHKLVDVEEVVLNYLNGPVSELKRDFKLPEGRDITPAMRAKIKDAFSRHVNHYRQLTREGKTRRDAIAQERITAFKAEVYNKKIPLTEAGIRENLELWFGREELENNPLVVNFALKITNMAHGDDLAKAEESRRKRHDQMKLDILQSDDPEGVISNVLTYIGDHDGEKGNPTLYASAVARAAQLISKFEDADSHKINSYFHRQVRTGVIRNMKMLRDIQHDLPDGSNVKKWITKNHNQVAEMLADYDDEEIVPGVKASDVPPARRAVEDGEGNLTDNSDNRKHVKTLVAIDPNPKTYKLLFDYAYKHGLMSPQLVEKLNSDAHKLPTYEEAGIMAASWFSVVNGGWRSKFEHQLSTETIGRLNKITNYFQTYSPVLDPGADNYNESKKHYGTFVKETQGQDPMYNRGSAELEKQINLSKKEGKDYVEDSINEAWEKVSSGPIEALQKFIHGTTQWDGKYAYSSANKFLRGLTEDEQVIVAKSWLGEIGNMLDPGNENFDATLTATFREHYIENLKRTGMDANNAPTHWALQRTIEDLVGGRHLGFSKYTPRVVGQGQLWRATTYSLEAAYPGGQGDIMMKRFLRENITSIDPQLLKYLPTTKQKVLRPEEDFDEWILKGYVRVLHDKFSPRNAPEYYVYINPPRDYRRDASASISEQMSASTIDVDRPLRGPIMLREKLKPGEFLPPEDREPNLQTYYDVERLRLNIGDVNFSKSVSETGATFKGRTPFTGQF